MKRTTKYEKNVTALTLLAGVKGKKDIGRYIEHYVNDKNGFTILTSNGTLEVPLDVVMTHKANPDSVAQDDIKNVYKSFKKFKAP